MITAAADPTVSQKPDAAGAALKGATEGIDATREGTALGIEAERGNALSAPETDESRVCNSVMRAMTEANAAPVWSSAPMISLDSRTGKLSLSRQDFGGETVQKHHFGNRF